MLERQMIDIIMPDVTIVGGIGELKKVAALAGCGEYGSRRTGRSDQ